VRGAVKFTLGLVGVAVTIVILGPLGMKVMDLIFKLLVK
jgi:hypothetical protein